MMIVIGAWRTGQWCSSATVDQLLRVTILLDWSMQYPCRIPWNRVDRIEDTLNHVWELQNVNNLNLNARI